MTQGGTALYASVGDLPPLVARAAALAERSGFELSCHPATGRLLAVLAAGRNGGLIGETGTGCGVGLAWMVSATTPDTRFVSIEADDERAAAAREVFAGRPNVEVLAGDALDLRTLGPFDLLVLDGGPGKRAENRPIDPVSWMTPGGAMVMDDFTVGMQNDPTRDHWFGHPDLHTTEIHVTGHDSVLVAIRAT